MPKGVYRKWEVGDFVVVKPINKRLKPRVGYILAKILEEGPHVWGGVTSYKVQIVAPKDILGRFVHAPNGVRGPEREADVIWVSKRILAEPAPRKIAKAVFDRVADS